MTSSPHVQSADIGVRPDPHSRMRRDRPVAQHITWSPVVDFDANALVAGVVLTFDRPGPGQVELDTRALDIRHVTTTYGRELPFTLTAPDPSLGSGLCFDLPEGTDAVRIGYRTTSGSTALQWTAPEQTADALGPFLYSQCQTIHARSMIPLHDSMSAKITFEASITAPSGCTVLMAGDRLGMDVLGDQVVARFRSSNPIPPYLLALAVGHLESRRIGPRSLVWAEPSVVAAAAWEFAGIEEMLTGAEALYGPYRWGTLDLLVMPPSYPYGGLENPGLVFLTPALVAGDRSLTDVLVHEIAHHWSGDLVTAASMDHFWINEGFTTHGERRITEATLGRGPADLNSALGLALLEKDLEFLHDRPELTRLRMDLAGLDPDATSTWVAHEKGSLFVRAIEESVGREAFDPFFRQFFDDFAFASITTETFVDYLRSALPQCDLDVDEWLHGEGLPPGTPAVRSDILDRIRAIGQRPVDDEDVHDWNAAAWSVYLAQQEPHPVEDLTAMDACFDLLHQGNLDLRALWLTLGVCSGYQPAVEGSWPFLASTGRMKYLKPLYEALLADPGTRAVAVRHYAANRSAYHPIARAVVDERFIRTGIDPAALDDADQGIP